MEKIYIKTTESCNLQCKHCYIGDYRKETRFFDENKTISWLFSYFNTHSINEEDILFSFHGGEPFLCDLSKMEKVTKAFPKAQFDATSNLMILTPNHIDFIKKYFVNKATGRPFIKTSWDYAIRFSDENQKLIWENNVKQLLANDIDVKVITCLTTELLENVSPKSYCQYMKRLGITYVDFERLTDNTTENKSLIPSYKTIDTWLTDVYKIKLLNVGMFTNMAQAISGNHIACRKRQCMSNVLTINADGTVGGCPNTAKQNYFYTIEGEEIIEQRNSLIVKESIRHTECYTCDLYGYCNGSCHQLSWQGTVCPEPKQLWRHIIYDMDMEKETKTQLLIDGI